ncbi:hypothetical protein R1sor_015990 [Riccia sorocarpa]|uniref:Myb-like domain-containing protein n=1 Tax=Riccia sorocarpa TaxID=122646 RepID=A0ABD3HHY1_9MARC
MGSTGHMKKKKRPWTQDEDEQLCRFMTNNDQALCWEEVPKLAGLLRSGKSCRTRWNYLRPRAREFMGLELFGQWGELSDEVDQPMSDSEETKSYYEDDEQSAES